LEVKSRGCISRNPGATLTHPDWESRAALHWAAQRDHSSVVEVLVSLCGDRLDVNARDAAPSPSRTPPAMRAQSSSQRGDVATMVSRREGHRRRGKGRRREKPLRLGPVEVVLRGRRLVVEDYESPSLFPIRVSELAAGAGLPAQRNFKAAFFFSRRTAGDEVRRDRAAVPGEGRLPRAARRGAGHAEPRAGARGADRAHRGTAHGHWPSAAVPWIRSSSKRMARL
jgi:hypothetical protein